MSSLRVLTTLFLRSGLDRTLAARSESAKIRTTAARSHPPGCFMGQRILIAGAGIGGLTAACCLMKAGHDVQVFEQAPVLGEIGAGIQMGANAMDALHYL